jgi:hypothetical protein
MRERHRQRSSATRPTSVILNRITSTGWPPAKKGSAVAEPRVDEPGDGLELEAVRHQKRLG